jgi:hypothetical protein
MYTKQQWIEKYVQIIMDKSRIDEKQAKSSAESSYEACHEINKSFFPHRPIMEPEDAVDDELSYWAGVRSFLNGL